MGWNTRSAGKKLVIGVWTKGLEQKILSGGSQNRSLEARKTILGSQNKGSETRKTILEGSEKCVWGKHNFLLRGSEYKVSGEKAIPRRGRHRKFEQIGLFQWWSEYMA